jgi:hypothetical protein
MFEPGIVLYIECQKNVRISSITYICSVIKCNSERNLPDSSQVPCSLLQGALIPDDAGNNEREGNLKNLCIEQKIHTNHLKWFISFLKNF